MGEFTLPLPLRLIGWLATLVMGITALALVVSWLT
jgi:hypothetical protein